MNKKTITIGIVCMFLLTSFLVGTAVGEKTAQATSNPGKDLVLELEIDSVLHGHIVGIHAAVTNKGNETVYGPITLTLTIKKGFYGFRKFDEKTFTLLSEGQSMNPDNRIDLGDWCPDQSVKNGIYIFQYKLDYEDDNPDNNIDSQRMLIINRNMWQFW